MRIAIGCDHGGYELKLIILDHIKSAGMATIDVGCFSKETVDYPDIAVEVARQILAGQADLGIMIDGAGIGSGMATNKIPGIRAAVCNDLYTSRNAREHNNANVLVMGSMVVGPGKAKEIIDRFISTSFAGGRHQRRVDKIDKLDQVKLNELKPLPETVQDIIRQVVHTFAKDHETGQSKDSEAALSSASDVPRLITEQWLRGQRKAGIMEIHLPPDSIITPLARDFLKDHGMKLLKK
jgi:ribose 5-phosphate isomerase B